MQGKGIHGGKWDVIQKEDEIAKLNVQLQQARAEANNLRQNAGRVRGGGDTGVYTQPKGAGRGRGSGARGRGGAVNNNTGRYMRGSDPDLETKRILICLKYNRGLCTDTNNCGQLHTCNHRVGQGTPCGHAHPSKDYH